MHTSLKTLIVATFLFASILPVKAQKSEYEQKKDSLLNAVVATEGQNKLDAYYNLNGLLYFHEQNSDTVLKYLYLNEKEAKKQNNLKAEMTVRKNIGGLLRNRGFYDKFLERAYDDLDFLEKHEFWENYYDLTRKIVESYRFAKQNKKALDVAMEFYEQAKQRDHSEGIQSTLYAIGFCYAANRRMDDAEKYFRMSLDEANRSGRVTDTKLTCYFRLTSTLLNLRKWDECEALLSQWEADIKEREKETNRPSDALYSDLYTMYMRYYIGIKDDVQAEKYCRLLEEGWPESEIVQIATTSSRASIYQDRKDWAKMLEYAEKAYKLNEKRNQLLTMSSLSEYKAKALNYLGRADECYAEIEHYVTLRDSLANQELNAQLDELRTQYEVDKITAENQKNIVEKQKARLSFFFAAGVGALLLIILIIWFFYSRKIYKKNVALVEKILEQEKDRAEIEKLRNIARENIDAEALRATPETDKLFEKLEKYMVENKPYTDEKLDRRTLAQAIGTNEKYLADAIKRNTDNLTVAGYIALYRLKHANTLLLKPAQEYTIDAVIFEAGFNSRSSFYELYRKKYGISPNEFRKIIQEKK